MHSKALWTGLKTQPERLVYVDQQERSTMLVPVFEPIHLQTSLIETPPTVTDLAERYLNEHAELHCKSRTVIGYRDMLKRFILPVLGGLEVDKVSRRHIFAFHHSLSHKPYQANRCLEIISKMFNLAEIWEWRPINSNPQKHIIRYKEVMRERYLTKKESERLVRVLNDPELVNGDLAASYLFRLLMLTGCRLGEILTLKWSYTDDEQSWLKLPDSKTGPKTVYVGKAVIQLLREIRLCPTRPITNPYVIWGRYEDRYLADPERKWRKFRLLAGIEDVRIHDLRHNFASQAANQGISLQMIGKLLGHKTITTTQRYAHLAAGEVRVAADRVSSGISELK